MKIVICSSEVVPFAKTGGLADVAGALPLALEKLGLEVIVVMPKYLCVEDSGFSLKKLDSDFSYASIGKKIKVYFIENSAYFNRIGLYGEKTGDYPDNLLRFSFYCRKTLELLKKINFCPQVIHLNDWQTALIPVYLNTRFKNDAFYKDIKTLLTIHNLAYQGLFPKEQFPQLGVKDSLFSIDGFEFYGKINFLKAGILFSDYINTVSQGYARQILTAQFGCGLENVLMKRKDVLTGIINGLDYSIWNPATDKYIFQNFDERSLSAKKVNKKGLQRVSGLNIKEDIALLGFVGRLAEQKGVDLLSGLIQRINALNVQAVFLGTGESKYHQLLTQAAKNVQGVFSLNLKFDDVLAHRIYAGCDMFLMPSRYEPCGLGQMISFKYATIPIVFNTGGLSDTVLNFDTKTRQGNGFVFNSYTIEDFLTAVVEARAVYAQKRTWNALLKKVMKLNFSWEESAKKYIDLYKKI